ncbi:membrane protein insertion efficiency factor YidD [Synergistes jonesii]|uniref:Putative membrane protein insertion efficiency factor n=2 Tax=Synergistes jonesii TaxID=2754 RepID=A0A073IM01_9BACT|nr:preprotein translocase [Synergistes jonesii]
MRIVTFCMLFCIKAYRSILSPHLGMAKCRFYPSCSEYAAEAISKYGPLIGLRLSAARIVKCGPWHEGGFDPVPGRDEIAAMFGRKYLTKNRSGLRKVR